MFKRERGDRSAVFNGVARRTFGNLFKKDLRLNKHGRIVSVRKSDIAKRLYAERGGIRKTVPAGKRESDTTDGKTVLPEGVSEDDTVVPGKT